MTLGVFLLYAAAYLLMFVTLKRCYRRLIPLRGFTEVLVSGFLLPLPLSVLNIAIMHMTDDPAVLLAYRIHMLLTCVIMYLLLLSIQHTRLVVREAQRVREAAQKQKEQYEFKREVIEQVNIRAHDLKKLLDRWEGSGRSPDPGMAARIRSELERYDRLVETGNVALDTVLSDAVLRSEREKIRFSYLLRGLKPLRFILLFTFILNVLFSQGTTTLLSIAFFRLTREGLENAVYFSLRLVFLVMGTSVLTLTTSPVQLTDALEHLMHPLARFGFPAHELAMMMTIALRFIPTLLEEADKIQKAQMARGADFESGNLLARARAMIPLLVPLFVSSFRRANDLAMAMEARCYRGGEHRTRLRELRYTRLDLYALLCMVAFFVLIIAEGMLLG